MSQDSSPHGFILSEAALYSFRDQDVFPDIISFSAAIPDHLKSLFLIPIQVDYSDNPTQVIASKVASFRYSNTDEANLFGDKTFVYDDNEPLIPGSEPGSIFEMETGLNKTHHQDLELNQDINIQVPTDISYMSDVDLTESGFSYPYRTEERPVRHSSDFVLVLPRGFVRFALKSDLLKSRTPKKIKDNAKKISVSLLSYDPRTRVFTFNTAGGEKPHTTRAALSDIDHVSLSCDCKFWRYNGPEFHADKNDYMLGQPYGSASSPDIRDPDKKYFLCKHTYAVLVRLDDFVNDVIDESWDKGIDPTNDNELLEEIDKEWDRLAAAVHIPIDDTILDEELEEAADAAHDEVSEIGEDSEEESEDSEEESENTDTDEEGEDTDEEGTDSEEDTESGGAGGEVESELEWSEEEGDEEEGPEQEIEEESEEPEEVEEEPEEVEEEPEEE